MNIKKLPTHDDYTVNNNWTVVLTKVITDGWNEERDVPQALLVKSMIALRELDDPAFANLRMFDQKRIVMDVIKVMEESPDATEVMHPSQHLAVNLTFDRARKIQTHLQDAGLRATIFPTTCY